MLSNRVHTRPGLALTAAPRRVCVVVASRRAAAAPEEAKPKRAASAYNLFVKDQYHNVQERLQRQGLAAGFAEVSKQLRQDWASLNDKQKEPYASQSNKQKEAVAASKSSKKKQNPDGPPKPITPYAAFTKENFAPIKAKNPNMTTPEIAKAIGQLWSKVPQAQKDARTAAYQREMEVYKTKLARGEM